VPTKSPNKPEPSDPLESALALGMSGVSKKKKLLVGVSGGRDSMVLLSALRALGFQKLVICHLDHSLRGKASRADAVFVAKQAGKLGCALESARAATRDFATTSRKSLELAARELRQAFFTECAKRHKCRELLLAHHADDQIETCLFNFLRGSGPAGLGGMRPVSKNGTLTIRRPMLGIHRDDIAAYQKRHRIPFREDASNLEKVHTRNKLRLVVLPAIEKALGSAFRKTIPRAAEIFRAEDDCLSALVPEIGVTLSCKELRALPLAIQRRAVLRWLRERGVFEPGWEETQRVLSLLDTTGPAKINLPGDMHARRRAGVIFLEKGRP
jgi:tRNA(Ile)-lysidine synthase